MRKVYYIFFSIFLFLLCFNISLGVSEYKKNILGMDCIAKDYDLSRYNIGNYYITKVNNLLGIYRKNYKTDILDFENDILFKNASVVYEDNNNYVIKQKSKENYNYFLFINNKLVWTIKDYKYSLYLKKTKKGDIYFTYSKRNSKGSLVETLVINGNEIKKYKYFSDFKELENGDLLFIGEKENGTNVLVIVDSTGKIKKESNEYSKIEKILLKNGKIFIENKTENGKVFLARLSSDLKEINRTPEYTHLNYGLFFNFEYGKIFIIFKKENGNDLLIGMSENFDNIKKYFEAKKIFYFKKLENGNIIIKVEKKNGKEILIFLDKNLKKISESKEYDEIYLEISGSGKSYVYSGKIDGITEFIKNGKLLGKYKLNNYYSKEGIVEKLSGFLYNTEKFFYLFDVYEKDHSKKNIFYIDGKIVDNGNFNIIEKQGKEKKEKYGYLSYNIYYIKDTGIKTFIKNKELNKKYKSSLYEFRLNGKKILSYNANPFLTNQISREKINNDLYFLVRDFFENKTYIIKNGKKLFEHKCLIYWLEISKKGNIIYSCKKKENNKKIEIYYVNGKEKNKFYENVKKILDFGKNNIIFVLDKINGQYSFSYNGKIESNEFTYLDNVQLEKNKLSFVEELSNKKLRIYSCSIENIGKFEKEDKILKINIFPYNQLLKQLNLSKNNLENNIKFKKYINIIDKLIKKIGENTEKKIFIYNNLNKILKEEKYNKIRDILEYIQAKIGIELYNDINVEKNIISKFVDYRKYLPKDFYYSDGAWSSGFLKGELGEIKILEKVGDYKLKSFYYQGSDSVNSFDITYINSKNKERKIVIYGHFIVPTKDDFIKKEVEKNKDKKITINGNDFYYLGKNTYLMKIKNSSLNGMFFYNTKGINDPFIEEYSRIY